MAPFKAWRDRSIQVFSDKTTKTKKLKNLKWNGLRSSINYLMEVWHPLLILAEVILYPSLTIFGKGTALSSSVICEHRKNQRCSFPCVLPILAQIFGFKSSDLHFFSISVHTLCWFHLLYKGSRFQSSETAILSYCHHPSLRRGAVWLGGKHFVLWCFPSKSNFRALLPLCAQQVLLPRLLLGFILWEAGQTLPIPKCIHGHSLYLLWDCFLCPERLCKFTQE